ncbi:MAG: tetratricopeptide repeat protein, partial [Actinomycetota bacterium]|nr:tetratricopeptide repeat protein [Actinomycetota bacterium]
MSAPSVPGVVVTPTDTVVRPGVVVTANVRPATDFTTPPAGGPPWNPPRGAAPAGGATPAG